MKKLLTPILSLFLVVSLSACLTSGERADRGTSSQQFEVPKHGVVIDARYDPRLDKLIPGYKILTVGLANRGFETLELNPLKDDWHVVDAAGKKHKAINTLRIKDPGLFSRLPLKLKQILEYPIGIAMGYSETIDLFFPAEVDLNYFRSVSFYSSHKKQTFDVMTNLYESPTHQQMASSPEMEQSKKSKDPRFDN